MIGKPLYPPGTKVYWRVRDDLTICGRVVKTGRGDYHVFTERPAKYYGMMLILTNQFSPSSGATLI